MKKQKKIIKNKHCNDCDKHLIKGYVFCSNTYQCNYVFHCNCKVISKKICKCGNIIKNSEIEYDNDDNLIFNHY